MKTIKRILFACSCFIIMLAASAGISHATHIQFNHEPAFDFEWDWSWNSGLKDGSLFWCMTGLDEERDDSTGTARYGSWHDIFKTIFTAKLRHSSKRASLIDPPAPAGLSFETAQPVPEPASMLLLGTGLFGLAAIARNSRFIKNP